MEFNEFCKEIRDNIGEYLLGYDFEDIQLQEISNDNNDNYMGLVISRANSNISPILHLEGYYRQYEITGNMNSIMKQIATEYGESSRKTDSIPRDIFDQKDMYFKNCFVRVINYDRNKEMLQEVPYKKYMDLAVTIRMIVFENEHGIGSIPVTHDKTAQLGINEKELYNAALENTEKFFPVQIQKLEDVIRMYDSSSDLPGTGIYVLTNMQMIGGASSILYAQNQITELAEEHGCGFYIVPSSTHEVLLCPDNEEMDSEMLQRTAVEVNEFVVSDIDFLSNSIYHFDKDSMEIKMELPDPQIDDRQNQRGL